MSRAYGNMYPGYRGNLEGGGQSKHTKIVRESWILTLSAPGHEPPILA